MESIFFNMEAHFISILDSEIEKIQEIIVRKGKIDRLYMNINFDSQVNFKSHFEFPSCFQFTFLKKADLKYFETFDNFDKISIFLISLIPSPLLDIFLLVPTVNIPIFIPTRKSPDKFIFTLP